VIREIEHQLVQVLIDNVPEGEARQHMQRKANDQWENEARRQEGLLNGPQVKEGADIVTSQDQVDDLLDQLGF